MYTELTHDGNDERRVGLIRAVVPGRVGAFGQPAASVCDSQDVLSRGTVIALAARSATMLMGSD